MVQGPELLEIVFDILWVVLRVGAAWMFFPVLSHPSIPMTVRSSMALAFSVALYPLVKSSLPEWSPLAPPALGILVLDVMKELTLGIGMGLVSRWVFTSIMAAAQWVGMQIGFSSGSVVDPESGNQETSWAEFHNWIGIMFFFGVGGHYWILQALTDSYLFNFSTMFERLTDAKMSFGFWSEVGTQFFVWMLKLSGPLVVATLLLQIALGVLSKFIPQINVWLVSIPITLGAGVFLFTILSPMYGNAIEEVLLGFRESQYMWLNFVGVR